LALQHVPTTLPSLHRVACTTTTWGERDGWSIFVQIMARVHVRNLRPVHQSEVNNDNKGHCTCLGLRANMLLGGKLMGVWIHPGS
jgi:hypothetical protein